MVAEISTVLNFEGHNLTFLEHSSGELLIKASDLAPSMEVNRDAVRHQVRQLSEEDVRVISIHTNKGARQASFLTRSGALQVLSTGRSEKCRRLRKVICDFFVDRMSEKNGGGNRDILSVLEEVARLGQSVINLTAEIAELKRPALRPIQHGSKKYGPADLHLLLGAEPDRLWRDGFSTSAAFLMEKVGRRVAGPTSAGLTTKTVNWCKRNGGEVRRYLKGGKVLTFLPRAALAKVYDGSEADQLLLTAPEAGKEVPAMRSHPKLE